MTLIKINAVNVLKTSTSVVLIMIATSFMTPVLAQTDKNTTKPDSSYNGDDTFIQMIDYSRPGKYHQLLGNLAGTWNWQGSRFSGNTNPDSNKVVIRFSGTLVRKPFATGRFFIVEQTSGKLQKLQSPIQDGKMKKDNYKNITIEGYDNVKKKFMLATINNHIGSDISFSEGNYDSVTKTITFYSEEELVPGKKTKTQELFIILDKDHYKLEYYEEQNGEYVKNTEIDCVRSKIK